MFYYFDKLKYTVIPGVTQNSHARAALIATLLNNLLFENVVFICVVFIFYCFATSTQLNGVPALIILSNKYYKTYMSSTTLYVAR